MSEFKNLTLTEKTALIKDLSLNIHRLQKKVSNRVESFMLSPKKGHQLNNQLAKHNKELKDLEDYKKWLKEYVKAL